VLLVLWAVSLCFSLCEFVRMALPERYGDEPSKQTIYFTVPFYCDIFFRRRVSHEETLRSLHKRTSSSFRPSTFEFSRIFLVTVNPAREITVIPCSFPYPPKFADCSTENNLTMCFPNRSCPGKPQRRSVIVRVCSVYLVSVYRVFGVRVLCTRWQ